MSINHIRTHGQETKVDKNKSAFSLTRNNRTNKTVEGRCADLNQNRQEKKTLASIIIPTYNYGRYLAGAIESALGQTCNDVEVILVDDGSTDNTREIAERYPVRYLYQEHKGVAAAMNFGIKQSTGEFFLCLGADDKIASDCLDRTLAKMNENPKNGLVFIGSRVWDEELEVENLLFPHKLFGKFSLRSGWESPQGCVLTRRAAFDSLPYGFDPTLPIAEDIDFCMRIVENGWRAEIILDPLHWWRWHADSRTRVNFDELRRFNGLMYGKIDFLQLYAKCHFWLRKPLGKVVLLMFHPVDFLRGVTEKVKANLWGNLAKGENARKIVEEIERAVDSRIVWAWNSQLRKYFRRRLKTLKSKMTGVPIETAEESWSSSISIFCRIVWRLIFR